MKRTFTFALFVFACVAVAWAGVELTSAKIYKKQGDFGKSLDFYNQACEKEPNNPEALFERGELLGMIAMEQQYIGLRKQVAGDVPDAQRIVLEKMIKDFDAINAMGDDKKAKKYQPKAKKISQDYWWEFYGKAVAADSVYRAMQESKSMENANKVISDGLDNASMAILLDPDHWSSRFVFAQFKGFQEKGDEFVKAWQDAIESLKRSTVDKTDSTYKDNLRYARLQLIQYYYSKPDYNKTMEMADEMLAAEPGLVEAVQYKAYALATLANDESRPAAERDSLKKSALSALNIAKTSNPEDENIVYYIGQFNLQLKDTAAALSAFDEFLTKAPNDGVVLAMQGVIYLEGDKFGNLDKAVEKLGAAKDAEPENGAYWTNYGIALLRKGRNEEGKKAMEKGKELSGN